MKIIVIGEGKAIYFLARQFITQGHTVTIINRDPDESRALSHQLDATVLLGHGSDPDTLGQAGARSADCLLAMTPHDHDNLVACQIASQEFNILRAIPLVNNPENEGVFRKLGVARLFSATRIMTSLLEEQTDFMPIINLMAFAQGTVNVSEVILPENAPVAGKSLQELELPRGFLLAAIIRNGEVRVPGGSTILQAGDQLILIGQTDRYKDALSILSGE